MKTLEEVIDKLEKADTTWSNIKNNLKYEDFRDALNYLKEYRKLDSLDAVAFSEDDNDPLTWDELKTMEGKPVWIEMLSHDIWEDPAHRVDSEWWVIGEIRKDDIIAATYLDEMELCEEDIGVIWQAYRKERE